MAARKRKRWSAPKKVRTPLGTCAVRYVRGLKDDDTDRPLAGQANYGEQRLNLNTEVRDEWCAFAHCRVYYHELTHFALEAAGLGVGSMLNKEQVEAICDAIATARAIEELGL